MIAPGEVRIRLAEDEDIEAVLLLDRSLGTLPHWPAAEYRLALGGTSGGPMRCFYVAEWDGQIVGMAVARIDRIGPSCFGQAGFGQAGFGQQGFAELETVGVSLTAQRQGLGGALCRAIIAWSWLQGGLHLDLEVRSRSAEAMALYQSLGFQDAGKRSNYYRDPVDDAVLMRLVLRAARVTPSPTE